MEIKVVTEKDGTIRLTLGVSAVEMDQRDAETLKCMLEDARTASLQAKGHYLYEHVLKFPREASN